MLLLFLNIFLSNNISVLKPLTVDSLCVCMCFQELMCAVTTMGAVRNCVSTMDQPQSASVPMAGLSTTQIAKVSVTPPSPPLVIAHITLYDSVLFKLADVLYYLILCPHQ